MFASLCLTVLIALPIVTTGKTLILKDLEHVNQNVNHLFGVSNKTGTGCDCSAKTYDCGCCVHMDFPQIHIDDTGCINITYLTHDYGISVVFAIDGIVLYNETVSARNPPPLCFGIPYLEKEASLCLDLYNLDVSPDAFSGCSKVEAELLDVKIGEVDLGCFRIPLAPTDRLQSLYELVKAVQMTRTRL